MQMQVDAGEALAEGEQRDARRQIDLEREARGPAHEGVELEVALRADTGDFGPQLQPATELEGVGGQREIRLGAQRQQRGRRQIDRYPSHARQFAGRRVVRVEAAGAECEVGLSPKPMSRPKSPARLNPATVEPVRLTRNRMWSGVISP